MKEIEHKGIQLTICENVYDPCHDSFLLCDILEQFRGIDCLEIGCGCGLVSLVLAKQGNRVVCTDINPYAVDCTRRNAERNGLDLTVVQGNMFEPVDGKFDMIVFNPPYLPTLDEDMVDKWHDTATAGGIDGLRETRRLLEEAPAHLKDNGTIFTVISSLSPEKAVAKMLEPFNVVQRTSKSISLKELI